MKNMMRSTTDLLIFDVDGVLIDTCDSFVATTAETVRWCWKNIYGGEVDGGDYTPDHFNLCKAHPAFNDDSLVTWMLLSCMEEHMDRSGDRSMRAAFPSLAGWKEFIDAVPPGATEDSTVKALTDRRPHRLSVAEVRTIFEEIYYGGEMYRRLMGPGRHKIPGEGCWKMEKPGLSRQWSELGLPVGIYTGRSPTEMELAWRHLGWSGFPREMLICSGDGILKPSPRGLELLCARAGASSPLFFGDTASDREAWLNFGKGGFVAIGPILKHEPHFDTLDEAVNALLQESAD
ncbi:MAG: HAD family hydrolase [Synergistaceae bacterium]|jgi:phosphoglycolate phosphatase-like HAD superfamily hydrolase|nr:HAD family hydrolase [Synergistaceae bacterium]